MTKIRNILKNTGKIIELLSSSYFAELLSKELSKKKDANITPRLGKGEIINHKYYLLQILN